MKYKFKVDYTAKGSNVVPIGAGTANFPLSKKFKAGDIVEGYSDIVESHSATLPDVRIYTTGGTKTDNSEWGNGPTQYFVSPSFLEPYILSVGSAASEVFVLPGGSIFVRKNAVYSALAGAAVGLLFGGWKSGLIGAGVGVGAFYVYHNWDSNMPDNPHFTFTNQGSNNALK